MNIDEIKKYIIDETDPEKLSRYMGSDDVDILSSLAANVHSSKDIFIRIMEHRNEIVDSLIAANASADEEILETLSHRDSVLVRLGVAENPNTPAHIIDALSNDPEEEVRKAALGVVPETSAMEKKKEDSIKVLPGNPLDHINSEQKTVILHICNDTGGYGKRGFSADIAEKYPHAKSMYIKWYKSKNRFELGRCQIVKVDDKAKTYVVNLIAQHGFRTQTNPEPMDYEALRNSLREFCNVSFLQDAKILIPKTRKNEWGTVSNILKEILGERDYAVYDRNAGKFRSEMEQINAIPIVEYARDMGLHPVRRGNKYYSLQEADSVMIDIRKNCFYRNSKFAPGFGGVAGGIVQFLMEFGEVSKEEAINILRKEIGLNPNYSPENLKKHIESLPPVPERGDIVLPEADAHNRNVYAYLLKERKVNRSIINYFLDNGLLYQDVKKNCVWVTKDEEGKPNFASLRSTGRKKFAMDVPGCDYNECFFIKGNRSDSLFVTEAIIDMMSVMSFIDNGPKDFEDMNWLSLNGTNKIMAIFRQLEKHPEITKLYLAMDNDTAGRNAAETVIAQLNKIGWKGSVCKWIPPVAKDWNQELQYHVALKSAKNLIIEDTQNALDETFRNFNDYSSLNSYTMSIYDEGQIPASVRDNLDTLKSIEDETIERRKKEEQEKDGGTFDSLPKQIKEAIREQQKRYGHNDDGINPKRDAEHMNSLDVNREDR